MEYQSENRINQVIESALKNLNSLIDVNTVVGQPIKTEEGACIDPVSKVTLGVLAGGGEYGKLNLFKKGSDLPFSAGNGAIISVKPCGFLLKDSLGQYKMIYAESGPYEKMLEKASDMLMNLQTKQDEN